MRRLGLGGVLLALGITALSAACETSEDTGARQSEAGTGGRGSGGTSGSGGTGAIGGTGGSGASGGSAGDDAGVGDSGGSSDSDPDGDAKGPGTLEPDSLAVRFANAVMERWPDPADIDRGANVFEYNRGIVLFGMTRVYERTSDARYLTYVQSFIDGVVDEQGNIDSPPDHSFDNIQPAVLILFLIEQGMTDPKYRLAAEKIRARYDSIPRNAEGGYWHKQNYPNEMWLDSIYMGQPFLIRYGRSFNCGAFCDDTPVEQTRLLAEHVTDDATGLLYHAWDQDRNAAWADPTTGRSPEIWGRGLGWYAMALVDMLEYLPAGHAGRAELLRILNRVAPALRNAQDSDTGLWHQVLDEGSRSDNWLESSASGMLVYSLKLAAERGYIDSSYLAVTERGFEGVKTLVTTDGAGLPVINGAVRGMGVQTSYSGYISQERLSNSSHGLCSILLAASVMEAR